MSTETANWNVSGSFFSSLLVTMWRHLGRRGSETDGRQLTEWRTQLGLGPAIGATFFSIDTEANDGQGTSGQVDAQAGGSSDADYHLPSYVLMLVGALFALI